MRAALTAFLACLALVLSACGGGASTGQHRFSGTKVPDYPVADVSLTDTDGETYNLAEESKKEPLTLVFFGYTHCPTECPIVMNTLAAVMNRLDESDRDRVQVVFVTTDPARDDRRTLRRYLDRYNPGFIGLTGGLKPIVRLGTSMKSYIGTADKLPSGGYDLGSHSTYVSAVEDGTTTVLWNMKTTPAQLATDVHTLLKKDA